MFTVNSKYENFDYQYIDLIIHCDLKTFRRAKDGKADDWEVQDSTGRWAFEPYLSEIVTDCYNSKPRDYSWTQDA